MVRSGNAIRVTLTDARDTGLRVVITVAARAISGQLLITDNGASVCDATAAVAQDVQATCGHTAVDISVNQQADGTIAGQMVTAPAAP